MVEMLECNHVPSAHEDQLDKKQSVCLLTADVLDQNNTQETTPPQAVSNNHSDVPHSTSYSYNKFGQVKLQASVFLEDALEYRSVHHKTNDFALKLYQWSHSAPAVYLVNVTTFLLLMLAFVEEPSSLIWSSDPRRGYTRVVLPPGYTEGVELVCLVILCIDTIVQSYLVTKHYERSFLRQYPWIAGGYVVLMISFIDVVISLALGNTVYRIRVRRLFRPYFFVQNTTLLKKTLKAMRNTLPEIASVLTLLSLHLYFFTMLGMLVFPHTHVHINGTHHHGEEFNNTEWQEYFKTIDNALMSLVVLLTTANNPDVMMPSYSENRLYALYFIVFSLIGTFLIFNLLTAIIYNQFRGYFKSSMQTSYFRRCVALSAAYNVIRSGSCHNVELHDGCTTDSKISLTVTIEVLAGTCMQPEKRNLLKQRTKPFLQDNVSEICYEEFCCLFEGIDSVVNATIQSQATVPMWRSRHMRLIQRIVMSRYFNLIGNLMVLLNAILMTVEIAIHYEESFQTVFSRLNIMNYIFVVYYCIEQVLKIISLGKRYFCTLSCLYDGLLSIALITVELVQLSEFGNQAADISTGLTLWDCARIVNILILLRLLRIIPNFKPMALVTNVMVQIIRSLRSFMGIIILIYYVFAIIGMMAFEKAIDPPPGLKPNTNYDVITNVPDTTLTPPNAYKCGTYQQLEYWANNFDDFAASLVVLWDVMVVNNWGVFLTAFKDMVSPWSQIYFVAWWLVSAVVCVNLFVALILDHFIDKWEGSMQAGDVRRGTIQSLFQRHLQRPSDQRIEDELRKHPNFV
ncbi:LOW QUALITY PROTEIN: two pore channel protein 2 [Ciona intestinalis]